jgi:3-deoxy-manno-octulosonate cytidylyltransferase (CMP-KDO synthetase)
MKILGIIPARYASTRFPAKVLADIKGKTMIRRVYEQVAKSKLLSEIYVATDHELIAKEVESFGGKVIMTATNHPSGTDRCFEGLQLVQNELQEKSEKVVYNYVINIQGDEPFIRPEQIDLLAQSLIDGKGEVELATMMLQAQNQEDLDNNSEVFVTFNTNFEALYFSRFPIPFQQKVPKSQWLSTHSYYKHLGMYAYRSNILEKITKLSVSSLEKCESLEQLRWLENGFKIKLVSTKHDSYCIDTPEDLAKVLAMFDKNV